MIRRDMKWLPRELDKFRQLWALGLSYKEIARRLNRPAMSVEKARSRYNLPSRGAGAYRGPAKPVVSQHSMMGEPIGQLWRNMKRETPEQAAQWAKLLGGR